MEPQILCVSSGCFAVPLLRYLNNVVRDFVMDSDTVAPEEHGLALLLYITLFTSQWFWYNPVQFGYAHRIDSLAAKTTAAAFLLDRIRRSRFDWFYIILLSAILITAGCSHYFSSNQWCCTKHITFHGLLHFIAAFGFFITFDSGDE